MTVSSQTEGFITMETHPQVDPMACIGSEVSEPYWRGLSEGRLMIPVCHACGRTFFFPRRWCPHCWSPEIGWAAATGRGTVYSACMVNIAFDGRSADEVPYAVALVDLDEGIRIPGRLHPSDMAATAGQSVTIVFGDDPTRTLPVWVTNPGRDATEAQGTP